MSYTDDLLAESDPQLARTQVAAAERRRIGIVAAHNYLQAYLLAHPNISGEVRAELDAYEYMAVAVCGIGTPHSAIGECDLTPRERAMEFLELGELPELAYWQNTPAAKRFLAELRTTP